VRQTVCGSERTALTALTARTSRALHCDQRVQMTIIKEFIYSPPNLNLCLHLSPFECSSSDFRLPTSLAFIPVEKSGRKMGPKEGHDILHDADGRSSGAALSVCVGRAATD